MTKDEFLDMIYEEIEKAKKQQHDALSDMKSVEDTYGKFSGAYQKAARKAKLVDIKVRLLSRFVKLPAYKRVQAMSDIEIEEYRKGKIARLDSENQAEERKRLSAETPEEIRKDILSKIEGSDRLDLEIGDMSTPLSEETELFAKLAEDPSKEQHMQVLYSRYKDLLDKEQRLMEHDVAFFEPGYVPEVLIEKMKSLSPDAFHIPSGVADWSQKTHEPAFMDLFLSLGSRTKNAASVTNMGLEDAIKCISEVQEIFEKEQESYHRKFDGGKMATIALFYMFDSNKSDVDMSFLDLHRDILGDSVVDELAELAKRKEAILKSKFIGKRSKADDIDAINAEIREKQLPVYDRIVDWYEHYHDDTLGISSFRFPEGMKHPTEEQAEMMFRNLGSCIGKLDEQVYIASYWLTDARKILERKVEEREKQRSAIETERDEVVRQMREFVGDKHESITHFGRDPLSAYEEVQRREIVGNVQHEAQRQADMREAELRGISVEQLLQDRTQQSGHTNDGDGEISTGMKH